MVGPFSSLGATPQGAENPWTQGDRWGRGNPGVRSPFASNREDDAETRDSSRQPAVVEDFWGQHVRKEVRARLRRLNATSRRAIREAANGDAEAHALIGLRLPALRSTSSRPNRS